MFNSSSDKENLINSEKKISNDFVVHNMPDANSFSGQTFSNINPTPKIDTVSAPDNGLSSHHKVGILIIAGGVILIAVLIYLAYIFMIKPVATVTTPNTPVVEKAQPEPVQEEPIVVNAPITNIEVIATTTATSTVATTTEELLPEEKNTTPVFGIVSVIDTDLDGLTDDEEKIIGTNPNVADTDGDGFLDISELKSGYNPLVSGKKMDDKTTLNRSQIDSKASILFLNSWDQTRSDVNKTVIFTDAEKSFIQVTSQDNEGKLLPNAWYEKQFPGMTPGEAISGDSWSGFYSQDNAAAYIFSNDLSKIYTVSYSPLVENDLSYPLYRLMVKTMIIK